MSTMEEWRSIEGFPGYEVSDLGNVRCWRPRNARAGKPSQPRAVQHTFTHGYAYVSMSIDGVVARRRVHLLVLETFVGPKPDGMVGRHVNDKDRANCRLDNLAWGTPTQNQADRKVHGTHLCGTAVKTAKLTDEQAASIYAASGTMESIGEAHGVSRHTVGLIKAGRSWKHVTGAKGTGHGV